MFKAQSSASDGQMNVRMLIELAAIGMQGYKQAYFDIKLFGPLLVAQVKSLLSRGQLLAKAGQSLSVMVKVMCCYSQLGRMCCCSGIHCSVAFMLQGAVAFAFTTLADVFSVRTVGRSATTIQANAHGIRPAGKYPLDNQFGPFGDDVAVFSEQITGPQPSSIWKWSFAGRGMCTHRSIASYNG